MPSRLEKLAFSLYTFINKNSNLIFYRYFYLKIKQCIRKFIISVKSKRCVAIFLAIFMIYISFILLSGVQFITKHLITKKLKNDCLRKMI